MLLDFLPFAFYFRKWQHYHLDILGGGYTHVLECIVKNRPPLKHTHTPNSSSSLKHRLRLPIWCICTHTNVAFFTESNRVEQHYISFSTNGSDFVGIAYLLKMDLQHFGTDTVLNPLGMVTGLEGISRGPRFLPPPVPCSGEMLCMGRNIAPQLCLVKYLSEKKTTVPCSGLLNVLNNNVNTMLQYS